MIARLEVRTAYHMLSVRTFSERWGGAPQMDIRPDEQVSVYPPWGASIDAGSEYGPFTVVMAIGEKCEMDSAPELADMDRDWQGWMTFLDDTVDVHAFDGVQMGLDELQLSGPGEHQVRISWRYIPKAATHEYDRELWSETVIIRLDEPGQAVG